jgi:hypothetical protein
MQTYSFLNFHVTLAGPGGIISLGAGSGSAEEGVDCEFVEDTNKLTIGADGQGMHSLNASRRGKVTVRLLKTSPVNQLLMNMYNFQRTSASLWGQNVMSLNDIARGDNYTCQEVAFVKPPTNKYGKEAGMLDWVFDAIQMDSALGAGI